MDTRLYITVSDGGEVKRLKLELEQLHLYYKQRKIEKTDDGSFILYTLITELDAPNILKSISSKYDGLGLYQIEKLDKSTDLESSVVAFYKDNDISLSDSETLLSQLPKKWSLYPPLLLFQSGTFDTPQWEEELSKLYKATLSDAFWTYILTTCFPGITHIAINKPIIECDIQRRPFNIFPVYGDFGPLVPFDTEPTDQDFQSAFWCTVVQNGIHQTWAPRYTMFSRGNIKEKKRLLDSFTQLDGQVVMDLYAGIGYFTLSYLKNGAIVFCWELNPWSVEALVRGCANNKVGSRVVRKDEIFTKEMYDELVNQGVRAFIFNESNEMVPERMKQLGQNVPLAHVNLGLLPSSKPSWPLVTGLIDGYSSEKSTLVHVHENCHVSQFEELKQEILSFFRGSKFLHLEKVKTFAPDVWHVVVDIEVYSRVNGTV